MPIYDFGYRPWHGRLRSRLLRWWPITRVGALMALRSRLLRRTLFVSWMPLLYFGPLFFFVGSVTESHDGQSVIGFPMLQGVLGFELAERLRYDPQTVRPAAWSLAFYFFLGHTQGIAMMLVMAMVGPPLISHDVRSKSFLLYFSKSITRIEYLLGKIGILAVYLALVSLLPALALYAVSIAFAPTLSALVQTSATIARLSVAWVAVATPFALLMMFLSSLTTQPRYATFMWIAYWVLGQLFYGVLAISPGLQDASWTFALSPHELSLTVIADVFNVSEQLGELGVQQKIAGYKPTHSAALAWTVLAGISAVSLAGLLRRVSAPMRI
jgi:ABC-2 type transport system permease protein